MEPSELQNNEHQTDHSQNRSKGDQNIQVTIIVITLLYHGVIKGISQPKYDHTLEQQEEEADHQWEVAIPLEEVIWDPESHHECRQDQKEFCHPSAIVEICWAVHSGEHQDKDQNMEAHEHKRHPENCTCSKTTRASLGTINVVISPFKNFFGSEQKDERDEHPEEGEEYVPNFGQGFLVCSESSARSAKYKATTFACTADSGRTDSTHFYILNFQL